VALTIDKSILNLQSLSSIPTYFFIVMLFLTIGIGLVRYFAGSLGEVVNPPELHLIGPVTGLSAFLILRAFASGTAALTGIEAISNGITAFKEPRSRNAGLTLLIMSVLLAAMFLSVTFLSHEIGAIPSQVETVISQLARTVFGSEGIGYIFYLGAVGATTVIFQFPSQSVPMNTLRPPAGPQSPSSPASARPLTAPPACRPAARPRLPARGIQ